MIRQKRKGFSVFLLSAVAVWLMAYSVFVPDRVMATARSALGIFAYSVLPSIALFSVCAKLLLKTNVLSSPFMRKLQPLLEPIGMSSSGFAAFLVGSFAGFPMGAAMLADLCKNKDISRAEAVSLLPFCNQAGAAFLVGTVGEALLGDVRKGYSLLFAQTATAWICVCLTAHERSRGNKKEAVGGICEVSIFSALTEAVRESVFAMLGVCGSIVFFSLVSTALFDTLRSLGLSLGGVLCTVIGGFLEISCGFVSLSEIVLSEEGVLCLGGMILGFGGICVFMQAMERTEKICCSPRKYFEGKLLSGAICPLLALAFFRISENDNGKFLSIASFLFVICIFYFFNCLKIKFFSKKCGKLERNAV